MVSTRSKPTSQNPQTVSQMVLSRPLENFKAAVMRIVADNLDRPITAEEERRIEEDIREKAQMLSRTPQHPPYAAMICKALQELNEEGGSSEESISDFIEKEFPDLPWAHSAYLKHHLCKLCSEEILVNTDNRYVLGDENTPNAASFKRDKPKAELRKARGRPCKKRNNAEEKLGRSGLEVAVLEEKNEVTKEVNQHIEELHGMIENGQEEHRPMRIRFRLSENEPTTETILPLTVVDEDQHVLDYSGLGGSSKTPLDLVENVEKNQGRQLKPVYRSKKPGASTTAFILDLTQAKSQPLDKVKGRGRGRPRKNEIYGESEAKNFRNQQQRRGRGRPRKETEVENLEKRQQPKRPGRPRKVDS